MIMNNFKGNMFICEYSTYKIKEIDKKIIIFIENNLGKKITINDFNNKKEKHFNVKLIDRDVYIKISNLDKKEKEMLNSTKEVGVLVLKNKKIADIFIGQEIDKNKKLLMAGSKEDTKSSI